jgi:hypothetical protein
MPFGDSNFCVECNKPQDFETVDDSHVLYCVACGWMLNEIQAANAAENWEPPDDPIAWSGGFAPNH